MSLTWNISDKIIVLSQRYWSDVQIRFLHSVLQSPVWGPSLKFIWCGFQLYQGIVFVIDWRKCSKTNLWLFLFFFFKIDWFMIDLERESEREREAETQEEGEAGSTPGAWHGTRSRSRDSRNSALGQRQAPNRWATQGSPFVALPECRGLSQMGLLKP